MNRIFRVAALAAGTVATAVAVLNAINGNWHVTVWALAASAAWMLLIAHQCPAPAPATRGVVAITFHGGPLDGADVPLPPIELPEMLGAELVVSGTTYTVTTVEHTCYTAEAAGPAPTEAHR